jgi:hypothetical protein
MNQRAAGDWRDLAQVWQSGLAPLNGEDVERLHERQRRRLRLARGFELACTVLGITASLWLALASRFRLLGILTALALGASVIFLLRVRRQPVPPGSTDLLQSLQLSIEYQDWLAEQLRYGRVLGFMALFAVVVSASTQLLHMPRTTASGLIAAAVAALAIGAALAWNMTLAWQVWQRSRWLNAFRRALMDGPNDSAT